MKKNIIFIFTAILSTILITNVSAQKIKARVTVTMNLPDANKEKLQNFQQILESYINNSNWTNNEVDVEIPINMQIFFESAITGISYEDQYNINILISDNSDVQYFDKRCRMEYQKGEILVHSDNSWDSLTSLIDFYIYLLLGDELDKFGLFMGTSYFDKAKYVAEQAKFGEGQFQEGWDLRIKAIQQILSDENKKFREMKDFYYYGIFLVEDDVNKARKYCRAAVDIIEEIMPRETAHEKCKKFLSAHYIELIELFKNDNDKEIFNQLIKLDPDHAEIYREYL